MTARPGTQTTVLLQWVMGDVWYQDNLEYLSDLLTPYPLPPPPSILLHFWRLYFFYFLKKCRPRPTWPKGSYATGRGPTFYRGGGGGGGAIAYSLYPYQQCFRESAFLAFLTIYILSFISFSKVTLRPEYKFDKFALIDFCLARRHIRFSEF